MYVLISTHNTPATEDNFYDKHGTLNLNGNAFKLQIVQDYKLHVGYLGKGDIMMKS